ncbi:MAG: HAD family hydrolase [Ignavibacteriaceae bacterium]|nr:HAD family hydrolase [Ignavibacteriaceae bacterium]
MFDRERLRRIKIIAADLDGTLLSNDAEISDRAKHLIKELKKKGVLFTFASGRLHCALTSYAEELGLDVPLISLDGSIIKNHRDGNVIYESFVPARYVKKALMYSEQFLLNIALCHADSIYYTERNAVIPQMIEKFGARYEEVLKYNGLVNNTLEITIASDYKDNIKYVRDRMRFPHTFGLNISYFKSHSHNGIYYLEIRKKSTNKGKALKILLRSLGIRQSETAVIGDWYNDISLFLPGVLKVTLNNSLPELKRIADVEISKDNNNNGAAEFLEMVLKAKS